MQVSNAFSYTDSCTFALTATDNGVAVSGSSTSYDFAVSILLCG